jgi:hypothetical protein
MHDLLRLLVAYKSTLEALEWSPPPAMPDMTASQFVLQYDTAERRRIAVEQFDDPVAAADAVVALERRHRNSRLVHVVMLSGESLGSIKATHGTHFRDTPDFMDSLAAAA